MSFLDVTSSKNTCEISVHSSPGLTLSLALVSSYVLMYGCHTTRDMVSGFPLARSRHVVWSLASHWLIRVT